MFKFNLKLPFDSYITIDFRNFFFYNDLFCCWRIRSKLKIKMKPVNLNLKCTFLYYPLISIFLI